MQFNNKKLYIAPYTNLTKRLKEILLEQKIIFLGFIDKNINDEKVYKVKDIINTDFDYILILSPNHFYSIYDEYSLHIQLSKLVHVGLGYEDYSYMIYDKKPKEKFFTYFPTKHTQESDKIVFISQNFISSNNKHFYLFCQNINKNTIILTDNIKQLETLQRLNLKAKQLNTKEADYEIATAKFIIFDQVGYDEKMPPLAKHQITIQLWHGVGLKKLTSTSKTLYDYYISTSNWTNETNFQKIFNSKNFTNFGYARNDVLFKEKLSGLDIIFCDEYVLKHISKSNKKIALYMPTYKHPGEKPFFLDLDEFDKKLEATNYIIILKLHPFMLTYYKYKLDNKYNNILIHNAHGDIYPLLKYVDVLISDYSSIVYDFLLLDRKIILYNYDKDEYNKYMDFLYDYDEFSPGIQVQTLDQLICEITNPKDELKDKRTKLRNIFFDFCDGNSSKRIYENIILKEITK